MAAVVLALCLGAAGAAFGADGAAHRAAGAPGTEHRAQPAPGDHWVDTWTATPQLTEDTNMPPAPFTGDGEVLVDSTLRQTVHVSVGGERLRLRFSNAFGGAPLPLTAASVALPAGGAAGASATEPGSARPLTFRGRAGTTVQRGAQVVSDPLDFTVGPGADLTVTLYLARGQASTDITSHPGSRTASYLVRGDHLDDTGLPGAASVEHWYFLSGAEVWSPRATRATAVLGDSLTDGRGSTSNRNDRWPDQLRARLLADPGTAGNAVVNQGAGGNRVLNDGLGPAGVARLDRDVLAQSGVTSLIVFEGVNDIGTAPADEASQQRVADDLISAFDQIVVQAHAQGIRVYGATLTPFGGYADYDDPDGNRAAARRTVNDWIRTGGRFDAVVDLDRAVRDPGLPGRVNPAYDVGDHLHLNPEGYGELAAAFPLDLFHDRRLPPGSGFD
ncbi:SGNH/GDSL hydrolase family protein [Streptomyces sp. NPDC050560]|uniref:SGNH/GDSL hydrolase family protein n=1 Tax=Streptomyces sp. NPDC050560 TaxID=3365630 RepID=UPI0037BDDA5E